MKNKFEQEKSIIEKVKYKFEEERREERKGKRNVEEMKGRVEQNVI